MTGKEKRAVVIGGSLGGLFTGNMLRTAGWEVDIYERSPHDLDSRGGGIVLQPEVVEVFRRTGASLGRALGVDSEDRLVYERDGTLRSRHQAPQTQTSWNLIYHGMRGVFPDEHYHRGMNLVDIVENGDQAVAVFEDGTSASGDLVIGADGGRSTVRSRIAPGNEPHYAGYVAWRGLIHERDVPDAARELIGHFAFASMARSHMLGYLVPGDDQSTQVGDRYYNFVWYRVVDELEELPSIMTDIHGKARGYSIPPGLLKERWVEHVREEADRLLPPQFRAVVHAAKQPFAQAILDLTSERMVYGRVLLLGDAAFIPRPHTAASTAKAATNALALAAALKEPTTEEEMGRALHRWEVAQLRLGQALYWQGSRVGDRLLFHTQ